MTDLLALVWRRARWQPRAPLLLAVVVAITAWLPWAVGALAARFEANLARRAAAVPLVVGAPGSRVDLTLAVLWLRPLALAPLPARLADEVNASGLGIAIPLVLGLRAQGEAVVGTGPEYFERRGLVAGAGDLPRLLGDAVLGAAVAQRLGLAVGAALPMDPDRPYDLTRAAALRLTVVGVLAPTGGPEDEVVFTDVRTAWAAQGHIHGHRPAVSATAAADDPVFEAATAANRSTFHAHGEVGAFPLTALWVQPNDARAATLLRARLDTQPGAQAVVPAEVIDELLGVVLKLRRLLAAQQVAVAVTTLALLGLVGVLIVRLRAAEVQTLVRLGASSQWIAGLFALEWVLVVGVGLALAAGLVGLTTALAPADWAWL